MDAQEARRILADVNEEEGPADLPASILPKLTIDDLPDGATIQVGTMKGGVLHLDWNGTLGRDGDVLYGEADHTWTRKYWYSPLGLEQYLDLIRRAVETRHRISGDVELSHYDDDGAYVALRFRIDTAEKNLGKAYDAVRKVADAVEDAAEQSADEVGQRIAEVAARLSGWGSETLDALVDAVETARSADHKGRTLEELCSRLFASVPGFAVTGRVRTETEEIDISVLNDSAEPRLRRMLAAFDPPEQRRKYLLLQEVLTDLRLRERAELGRALHGAIENLLEKPCGFTFRTARLDSTPDWVFLFGASKDWDRRTLLRSVEGLVRGALAFYGKTNCMFVIDRDGVSFEVGLPQPDYVPTEADQQIGDKFFSVLRVTSTDICSF